MRPGPRSLRPLATASWGSCCLVGNDGDSSASIFWGGTSGCPSSAHSAAFEPRVTDIVVVRAACGDRRASWIFTVCAHLPPLDQLSAARGGSGRTLPHQRLLAFALAVFSFQGRRWIRQLSGGLRCQHLSGSRRRAEATGFGVI